MNRYAQVLTASALAYTAQASAAAKWARGTTMSSPPHFMATAEQLVALTKEPRARHLVVCGNLANVPSIRLAPGQTLTGNGDNASISFVKGVDGLQLSSDNEVRNLRLEASAGRRAIFNDTSVARLGTIRLISITTVGHVQLLARDTWADRPQLNEPPLAIDGAAAHSDHRVDDDHYQQPGDFFLKMNAAQRQALLENTARGLFRRLPALFRSFFTY